MARCENCGAELQPQWKFCVRCGAKVTVTIDTDEPAPTTATATGVSPAPIIPAAIRPHELSDDTEQPVRRRFDWHVLAGILVGVLGAAAIVYLIVALTSGGS